MSSLVCAEEDNKNSVRERKARVQHKCIASNRVSEQTKQAGDFVPMLTECYCFKPPIKQAIEKLMGNQYNFRWEVGFSRAYCEALSCKRLLKRLLNQQKRVQSGHEGTQVSYPTAGSRQQSAPNTPKQPMRVYPLGRCRCSNTQTVHRRTRPERGWSCECTR